MSESLIQQYYVSEEGYSVVKLFHQGGTKTLLEEEVPANSVPAAAVIRGEQALFGMTRRKGFVDCLLRWKKKNRAQLYRFFQYL
jgi:hypothetical protein